MMLYRLAPQGAGHTNLFVVKKAVPSMIERIQKLKRRRGFTLVELIVVLVILAVLAAMLVPALTGYIDKAHTSKYIAYARYALIATQSVLDEMYADGVSAIELGKSYNDSTSHEKYQKEFRALLENMDVNSACFVFATPVGTEKWGYADVIQNAENYKISIAAYIYQESGGVNIKYYIMMASLGQKMVSALLFQAHKAEFII